ATFLVDPGMRVRFSSAEEIARRVPASEMLELIRSGSSTAVPNPKMRGVNPGAMFLRAIGNAFRHGVRVKRG
ncbi:MAG TPA: hypothetical protein VMT64_01375, partial [Candidatus Binataceae bacterium]|nr:hypothetical protein [Candidatus Binataceae bacterium]